MKFSVIIPARYASSRLPGKPLVDIGGAPMIKHVHDRAMQAGAHRVVIATDDQRIRDVAEGFGADVTMTASDHESGSDRLAEVAEILGLDDDEIIVNLQGDEPLMPPQTIRQVAEDLNSHTDADMASLCSPLEHIDDIFDPNVVKTILDKDGYAIYFSRAPAPWHRDSFHDNPTQLPDMDVFYRHIGLYCYRAGFLRQYVSWDPAPLEKIECLEQLRALWNGKRLYCGLAKHPSSGPSVDTEKDLHEVREIYFRSTQK